MKIKELNQTQKTIFNNLLALNVIHFITEENVDILNMSYYMEHAPELSISNYYKNMLELEEQEEIDSANEEVAKYISMRFSEKWNRIYDVLLEEYAPLENYRMTEEETPNITKSRETKLDVKTDTETNNYVSGFNSTIPQHTTKGTSTGDSLTTGAKEENFEIETGKRTLTRSGNIGVTTSQQMEESELKLREYDFYLVVFRDIDKILCSLQYNL